MKRLAVLGVGVLALWLASTAAAGASVETFPVSFELSSATCSLLPSGTTITGEGTEISVTNVRTDRDGVTTIANSTHASGTATDQSGNTYVFSYSNEFRVTNSTDDPGTFSGFMSDHFSLAGSGPARLNNGFTANITTDFASFFDFEELNSRGDPLDFATGVAHCDPL